jgi:hypothetical protein
MLEDSLRESFHSQVQLTPAASGRIDEVIRRGRAAQRRRLAGSWAVAVTTFVALIAGTAVWQGVTHPRYGQGSSSGFNADPLAGPTPAISLDPDDVAGIGLDLRIGDRLWTSDGRRIELAGTGDVTTVYRVPAGWIYGGADGVRLLSPDGATLSSADEAKDWAVSADGQRIAYVAGTSLHVEAIGTRGFTRQSTVAVPKGTAPAALLGDRVLVSAPVAKGRGFGFVDARATGSPKWNTSVLAVYGTRSDAATGLVRGDNGAGCIAALRPGPNGLAVARGSECELSTPKGDARQRLSPDGGWLAEPSTDNVMLVSVDRALAGLTHAVRCEAPGVRQAAWIDSTTVATASDSGVVRCHTDGSRTVVALPPEAGADWQLVPRLGANG